MVIKVENNKAYFTASDLEIQVSSSIDCESDDDCEFSLPARKLLEILSALSNYESVTFLYQIVKLISQQEKVKYHYQIYQLLIFHIWILRAW